MEIYLDFLEDLERSSPETKSRKKKTVRFLRK